MQNESTLIAPISSLQRYLAEANDSILNHSSNEEEQDNAYDMPSLHSHNLGELNKSQSNREVQTSKIDQ